MLLRSGIGESIDFSRRRIESRAEWMASGTRIPFSPRSRSHLSSECFQVRHRLQSYFKRSRPLKAAHQRSIPWKKTSQRPTKPHQSARAEQCPSWSHVLCANSHMLTVALIKCSWPNRCWLPCWAAQGKLAAKGEPSDQQRARFRAWRRAIAFFLPWTLL